MKSLGQNTLNIENIRSKVLMNYPVFNQFTIYSTSMVPLTGFIDTIPVDYKPNSLNETTRLD